MLLRGISNELLLHFDKVQLSAIHIILFFHVCLCVKHNFLNRPTDEISFCGSEKVWYNCPMSGQFGLHAELRDGNTKNKLAAIEVGS